MLSVFISYARKDGSDEAERLVAALQKETIPVWRDTKSLNPYEGFDTEIENAIEAATHIIVCITPDIRREDSFVRREIAFALEESKPIIPIVFPGGRRPITIINHTYIDFNDWDTGMLALVDRLRKPIDEVENPAEQRPRRELELAYLEAIGQRYDHWRELYTEMAATARIETPKVRVRNAAAARYLEMQHGIFDKISHNSDEEDEGRIIRVDDFIGLRDGIRKYRRIALIGDPGAGKTTTLERLAYDLAISAADDEEAPLPLFARLGAYGGGDFETFLESSFGGLTLSDFLPDRVMVLLDGLNEMPLQHVTRIDTWIRQHKETAVVVSCRKLDYIDLKLDLHRIDVMPLDVRRIYTFIGHYLEDEERDRLFWGLTDFQTKKAWGWFLHLREKDPDKFLEVFDAPPDDPPFETFWYKRVRGNIFPWEVEKQHLKTIQTALQEKDQLPGMLGVMTNPFLLFISINLFTRLGEPPSNRGQLFDQFVTLLIEKRGRPASKVRLPWIEEEIQRRALAALAYRMQMDRTGTSIDETWARDTLNKALPEQDSTQILYLAASAGVLEHGKTIRFVHQLLQEYFAAHEMALDLKRGVPASKYFPSERWWELTGWEETAVLLAGMGGDATEVVRWLTPIHPSLAYRCAAEGGTWIDDDVFKTLLEPPPGARVAPLARAKWGRAKAQEGDTRPGVGVHEDGLPDFVWCEIPSGEFIYQENEKRTLPTYYVAQYPVTMIQYQGFLDAPDGFCNDAWWEGLAKRQPTSGEQNFRYANHPRERVSWYDSVAFSRWLSTKLGYEVRLPTEEEWEKAARGTDGRFYPWGNEYLPGDANINETWDKTGPHYMRMTTAVGIYPRNVSPFGVHDLIGNVWEWTLTIYDTGKSDDFSSNQIRTQRGGAWRGNLNYSNTVHRHANKYPATRNYHVGLRLMTIAPPEKRK